MLTKIMITRRSGRKMKNNKEGKSKIKKKINRKNADWKHLEASKLECTSISRKPDTRYVHLTHGANKGNQKMKKCAKPRTKGVVHQIVKTVGNGAISTK